MKVAVIGPNLRRQDSSKGDIHVHAAECSDAAKTLKLNGLTERDMSVLDFDSRLDVAREWFDFLDDPAEGLSELWFAPCVEGLPEVGA